ncbi:hypothetical protein [Streptomyces sp. NPDC127038]|uniref:hypothetical protein n=1 Tax=Streptomyces sp. NPDC127038 TaxID=3347114 RepID=UPI0036603FD2
MGEADFWQDRGLADLVLYAGFGALALALLGALWPRLWVWGALAVLGASHIEHVAGRVILADTQAHSQSPAWVVMVGATAVLLAGAMMAFNALFAWLQSHAR